MSDDSTEEIRAINQIGCWRVIVIVVLIYCWIEIGNLRTRIESLEKSSPTAVPLVNKDTK